MEIFKEFTFEAAHKLTKVPEGHKCARLHGHSFSCTVSVEGEIDPDTGMIIDYAAINDAFSTIYKQLDHNYLNTLPGLYNPTSENIAKWIWMKLSPVFEQGRAKLSEVLIRETCNTGCVYRGE